MMAEQIMSALLGSGVVGAIATGIWQWKKYTVDRQVTTVEGMKALMDDVQQERTDARERADKEKARADAAEATVREVRAERDALMRENGALTHEIQALIAYMNATLLGVVAGTVPPWLEMPYTLHARFPPGGLPDVNPPVT